jgi:maleate cis-trans isomerase
MSARVALAGKFAVETDIGRCQCSHPVIEELEARIGEPVVTSTQAALWRLLRLVGVDTLIDGLASLTQEL